MGSKRSVSLVEFRTPVTRACARRLDKGLFLLSLYDSLSRTPLVFLDWPALLFREARHCFGDGKCHRTHWSECLAHSSKTSVCLCCICCSHISPLQTATPLSTRRSMSLACRSTMCHNSSILKTPKQMSFLSVSGGRKRQGFYIGQKGKNTGEQHVVARPLLFITSSFFPLYPYNSIFYLLPKQLLLTSD